MPRHRPVLFQVKHSEKPFRGRHWYVWGFKGEKRVQLWFKSEKAANEAAADRNADIKAHGTQVSLSPVARIQAIDAAERLAPYRKSISDAVSFYTQYLDRQASSISVAELCDRVTEEFQRRLDCREIQDRHFGSMKETLKKFRGRFAETPVKLLEGTEVKSWLAAQPLAVKTRNRHLGYIGNILGIAQEWNLLDGDPFAKVSTFNDPSAKTTQVAILTPEKMEKFLKVADTDFLPFFAMNAFTGLRRSEIILLDWSEVKLDRSLIDLPWHKSKNGKRKLIDVPENLAAWLKPHEQKEGSVMPHKKLQLAFENATQNSDNRPWHQNALRHSFCSYAVASKGFEWSAVQADHSVEILRKDYWEVVTKEDALKYWAIRP